MFDRHLLLVVFDLDLAHCRVAERSETLQKLGLPYSAGLSTEHPPHHAYLKRWKLKAQVASRSNTGQGCIASPMSSLQVLRVLYLEHDMLYLCQLSMLLMPLLLCCQLMLLLTGA